MCSVRLFDMGCDNVIIFGAGASFDAGIPLLNNFVDTMWSYSVRGKTAQGMITKADRELFAEADEIRINLERYNSRANFNLRNLEDVLSLLSFEALDGDEANQKYNTWVKAITRVVELSTAHPYLKDRQTPDFEKSIYHHFWDLLLGENSSSQPPALITFNYDLVLERTLWDYFHGSNAVHNKFKPKRVSCKINYSLKPHDFLITPEVCAFEKIEAGRLIRQTGFRPLIYRNAAAEIEIPYLKLHGSLNWCRQTTPNQKEIISDELLPANLPTQAAEQPLILPPVFNKMNMNNLDSVWRKALQVLREAKHIILVGYSLPKTDIYMQYFLKSAVGPNSNLQRIIVFDPVLFNKGTANDEMRKRYRDCFSPQFQEQIAFEPAPFLIRDANALGKFHHFIAAMRTNADNLLFNP